jgi:Protein of unknown function (DUF3011)
MKTKILTLVAGALMIAAPAFAITGQDSRVRCESGGSYHQCRVNNVGSVVLDRQLSKSSCVQGQTWGYTANGIWVDRGCRADFLVSNSYAAYGRDGNGTLITCESGGKKHRCSADTHFGVQMSRQISKSSCVEGDTWGYDERGVWVDRGCRAEFLLGTANTRYNDTHRASYGRGVSTLTCESDTNRTHTCAADTRFGVEIRRQLSHANCVYGKTWGYDTDGVWVSNGCRAEFTVGQ